MYLKNWTDNLSQIFFMGTSWVDLSLNNIKTRASREMTSRKHIKICQAFADTDTDTDTDIYFQIPQYIYKLFEIKFIIMYTKYVRNLRDQDSLSCLPLGPTEGRGEVLAISDYLVDIRVVVYLSTHKSICMYVN